ncbi:MAG: peptidylprolyl isomerase [Micromonosporaceae bacterium]|nr:peptidylprolyl isomerase [Micromonosporaceae bacterium]
MGSKSNRARRLERARAERRMARLAAAQRRRRQIQAGIAGVLALIVLGLGTAKLLGVFDKKSEPITLPTCTWTSRAITEGVEDTGLPPSDPPTTGIKTLVIETNRGQIEAVIDVASARCAAASLDFLASRGFYNDTRCHKLDTTLYTLTCGSKNGTDNSSVSYQFPTEGLPRPVLGQVSPSPTDPAADTSSYYLRGAIVMTNVDINAVGSQFMIVYQDGTALPNEYTQVATITSGLELVEQIAAGGAVDDNGEPAAVGNPTEDLTITRIQVRDDSSLVPSETPDETPTDAPSESPTTTSEATPTASAAS